jgi:hypothetical protein
MDDKWRTDIAKRIQEMEAQHTGLKRAIDDNTAMTVDIKKNTDDIVEFFLAAQGTFKALRVIGSIAKWFTAIAGAVAIVFVWWKGGSKP